jgi:hypothetical protein
LPDGYSRRQDFANAAIAASRVSSDPCAARCKTVVAARPHPGAVLRRDRRQEDAQITPTWWGSERPCALWPTMIRAFSKTREQVRGERHDGARGQQFHYIDQGLDEHVHDP